MRPTSVNWGGRVLERPDLATDRLHLRCPGAGDCDAIVQLAGDWEVASRLARVPHPYGLADARHFLEEVVPQEWVWAVFRRATGELAGMAGLTPAADGSAELGYWLGRDHWGAGIATEAARAVLVHGFAALRLPRVTSGYFEDNPASGRVLEKLGFAETGRARLHCLAVGSSRSSIRCELRGDQLASM